MTLCLILQLTYQGFVGDFPACPAWVGSWERRILAVLGAAQERADPHILSGGRVPSPFRSSVGFKLTHCRPSGSLASMNQCAGPVRAGERFVGAPIRACLVPFVCRDRSVE